MNGYLRLIYSLDSKYPEAAKDLRQRVEAAVDKEFGASPKPFPLQLFCEETGEDLLEVTVTAPGTKTSEKLRVGSVSGLDSDWKAFADSTVARIVEGLMRQTPGVADKAPEGNGDSETADG